MAFNKDNFKAWLADEFNHELVVEFEEDANFLKVLVKSTYDGRTILTREFTHAGLETEEWPWAEAHTKHFTKGAYLEFTGRPNGS